MRPRFYPTLVNDRFGDPALYVDFLLEKRAILFDLGDIYALPARSILRLTDVFVSHAHIDHFIGFDHLLRLLVGRNKRLRLYGPAGFIDRLQSKLEAYTWNLTDSFLADLVFIVTEVWGESAARRALFRLKNGFAREEDQDIAIADGVILDEASLRVSCAVLEHRTPCLGFALQEKAHVNVWKNRLAELGLAVGPWLGELKAAVLDGRPDDTPIRVQGCTGDASGEQTLPFGTLRRKVVSVTPGQKIGYITDVAFTQANGRAILELVGGADILFIEAAFTKADAARAAERAHLTATQAGALARKAAAGRVEPFHFSPRYAGEEALVIREVEEAFQR
jgi:ribonuclease Z